MPNGKISVLSRSSAGMGCNPILASLAIGNVSRQSNLVTSAASPRSQPIGYAVLMAFNRHKYFAQKQPPQANSTIGRHDTCVIRHLAALGHECGPDYPPYIQRIYPRRPESFMLRGQMRMTVVSMIGC
jgi:hypothetical protein